MRPEDEEHQDGGHPHDQEPQGPQVLLERRRRVFDGERRGRLAEQGRGTRRRHQGDGFPGLGDRSAEEGVDGLGGGGCCDGARGLVDRIGLTGQSRLVGREGGAFQDQGVGGDHVATADPDEIARRDLLGHHLDELAVAFGLCPHRHRLAQQLGGSHRPVFLHRVQADREGQDDHDDHCAGDVAGDARDDGRGQQHQRQGLQEPLRHRQQRSGASDGAVDVASVKPEPGLSVGLGQTVEAAAQGGRHSLGRKGPERLWESRR